MSFINDWLSDEGLILLAGKARECITKRELAEKMGVSENTLYRWMKKYPKIADAVKKGRELTDIEVENAILKKALGFQTKEIKTVKKADGSKEVTTVLKSIPPDISAATTWLVRRCPEKWSDRTEASINSQIDELLRGIDAQIDE